MPCLVCELLEELCDWLLAELLRLEEFLPELRVVLPLLLVLALLLELDDWCVEDELSDLWSTPNEEFADDDDEDELEDVAGFGGGGVTGEETMESSATRNYPLCPDPSCTLVRIMLLTAIERVLLFTLPANHGFTDSLGALRRTTPLELFRIALTARGLDDLRLLADGIFELE